MRWRTIGNVAAVILFVAAIAVWQTVNLASGVFVAGVALLCVLRGRGSEAAQIGGRAGARIGL